jgi:hypothetical protein
VAVGVTIPTEGEALTIEYEQDCWRCILVHQTCPLHFGLDLFMELTCY